MSSENALLSKLFCQLVGTTELAEARLQSEENGSKIANLQGFCKGQNIYAMLLKGTGFNMDLSFDKTCFISVDKNGAECCNLSFSELSKINSEIEELEDDDDYKNLLKAIEEKVNERKNKLFYDSEKGRDLYWCEGWYEAITKIEYWIKELRFFHNVNKQKIDKAKKEELPFNEVNA